MKLIQALKDFNMLLKEVTKTIKNETKEQTGGFLGMLLVNLGTNFLGYMITDKEMLRAAS